jgi:poly-gamma-glutamate synthesis protein (capsule biosynthesis protein)
MIFCGDTIFTGTFDSAIVSECDKNFLQRPKAVNLESLIDLGQMKKTAPGIGLLSSPDIVDLFKAIQVEICLLANNHVTDFDVSIESQKRFLSESGIRACGAGDDLEMASLPCFFTQDDEEYGILPFGWETISCVAATDRSKGVNPLRYGHIMESVKNFFDEFPGKRLVVVFHWNYEYEQYPQPAHRKLAYDLIEMGVEAIIGHHPHIVQGAELHRGKPIFYSLGNFYFPAGVHSGFPVTPPDKAYHGLCVELSSKEASRPTLYWTHLGKNGRLRIENEEKLDESEKIAELTPFAGMPHEEYIEWFRKHRHKKRLLPIYKDPAAKLATTLNDLWVGTRQQLIDFLVRMRSRQFR